MCVENPLNLNPGRYSSNVGKVASKGLEVADKVANNPIVQAAVPLIPGGSEVLAAESVTEYLSSVQIH